MTDKNQISPEPKKLPVKISPKNPSNPNSPGLKKNASNKKNKSTKSDKKQKSIKKIVEPIKNSAEKENNDGIDSDTKVDS